MDELRPLSVSSVAYQLHALVDECVLDHTEFLITKNGNPCAVMLSYEDYQAMKAELEAKSA